MGDERESDPNFFSISHREKPLKRLLRQFTVQWVAAHESPRTTKLYDLTSDQPSLNKVERVAF